MNRLIVTAALIVAGASLASCSSSDPSAVSVAVTGTNDACQAATTTVKSGPVNFEFTNQADAVNELYVLKADGSIVSEVENVTTGTTRSLQVELGVGAYTLQCKPGQTGDGFLATIEATEI
jgi:iron uptake system EfeUOB component EfeO/EfeM